MIDFEAACSIKDGVTLPCEVGIVQFCFNRGIVREFHRFIYPGPIPSAHVQTALYNQRNIHGIPFLDFELAERDYQAIWTEMLTFLATGKRSPSSVKLYAKARYVENTALQWLSHKVGFLFPFAQVQEVSSLIKSRLWAAGVVESTISEVVNKFNDYQTALSTKCAWHEQQDARENKDFHCALSDVRRYCRALYQVVGPVLYPKRTFSKHPLQWKSWFVEFEMPLSFAESTLPCELALAEIGMDGVVSAFHRFVHPGDPASTPALRKQLLVYEALVHGIPTPPPDPAAENYRLLMLDLVRFVTPASLSSEVRLYSRVCLVA